MRATLRAHPVAWTATLLLATACAPDIPTVATVNETPITPRQSWVYPGANVVVQHGAMQGWVFYNDEHDVMDNTLGSFVAGPGSAPVGTGSAQISVSGTQRRNLATYQFAGTPLADITVLKYSTYNASATNAGSANRAGYLNINISFDGTDTWQRRLIFLPSDNGAINQDSWDTWDAINGGNALWRYSGPTWPSSGTPGSTPRTWDDLVTSYPGIKIRDTDAHFGIRVGEPYSDGYTENIDNVQFGTAAGTTTFDFEPGLPTAPTNVALTITPSSPAVGTNNLTGMGGDAAPAFPAGSFASDGSGKSEIYFDPAALFPGRTVALGDIQRISYWTKKGTLHSVDPRDWYFLIYTRQYIGQSAANWYGARIGTEPYFSQNLADPAGTWVNWTTDGASNRLRFFESTAGATGANFGSYTDPDWATFVAGSALSGPIGDGSAYAGQDVLLFSIQTGSGWADGFTGQVDGLRIELTDGSIATVNFEPDDDPPVVTNVVATPNPAAVNGAVALTANVSDLATGNSTIVSASYSLNGGAWMPMAASDGAFDSPDEDVQAGFTAPADPAIYQLCVQGTDASGNTSTAECTDLVVYDPSAGFVTGGGWIDSPSGAAAQTVISTVWDQHFEGGTDGWFDTDVAGWEGYGDIAQVASGTNGIASPSGTFHASVVGVEDPSDHKFYGPFSRFDGYRATWPGTWTASIAIYLDPSWAAGAGFDYSVASSNSAGNHRRDFIFHVTKDISTGQLLVAGSNNTNFAPRQDLETINHYAVTTAGWYTLRHTFRDNGGVLAVDLQLLDAGGTVLFTETRSDPSDLIPSVVGGNRYAWFTHVTGVTLAVDDHKLQLSTLVDPTGKATFGFVSKYTKGKTVPTGQTQFTFKAGDINFHSDNYEWLIVNQAGKNAQFKGRGTINGAGDYTFMLWAGDGDKDNDPLTHDTFRIKIWDTNTNAVAYDNGVDQVIAGGNIMVHTGKK